MSHVKRHCLIPQGTLVSVASLLQALHPLCPSPAVKGKATKTKDLSLGSEWEGTVLRALKSQLLKTETVASFSVTGRKHKTHKTRVALSFCV